VKPIVARDQVRLGAARCLKLALTGMSYRMFRSSVTIAILALAVAFLVHMLTYGLMTNEAQISSYEELKKSRELGQQITRLTTPDNKATIMANLAAGDPQRLAEYRVWAREQARNLPRAQRAALRLEQAADYMDALPVAAHAVLVGDFSAEELFDRLEKRDQFLRFAKKVQQLGLPAPLSSISEFERLLNVERPIVLDVVTAIQQGHAAAIGALKTSYPGRAPGELAANPPPDFGNTIRSGGFSLDNSRLPELTAFARRAEELKLVNRLILAADTRARIARETDLELGEVSFESVMNHIDGDEDRAQWLREVLGAGSASPRLSAARLAELSESYLRERKLQRAVGEEVPDARGGLLGMPERSRWLIALSFLVCVVGVANAMLMSVTERFTEIATMKCLGAMDRFVMVMFVFEAIIQGMIGGAIGLTLGVLLALLRGLVEFGSLLAEAGGAAGEIALGMLLSLALGMILAAVAAVGPSWIAARLAPMEAMRVD
jgi:putative ABC transport system permease protein